MLEQSVQFFLVMRTHERTQWNWLNRGAIAKVHHPIAVVIRLSNFDATNLGIGDHVCQYLPVLFHLVTRAISGC
jgi:hypothetical protein